MSLIQDLFNPDDWESKMMYVTLTNTYCTQFLGMRDFKKGLQNSSLGDKYQYHIIIQSEHILYNVQWEIKSLGACKLWNVCYIDTFNNWKSLSF